MSYRTASTPAVARGSRASFAVWCAGPHLRRRRLSALRPLPGKRLAPGAFLCRTPPVAWQERSGAARPAPRKLPWVRHPPDYVVSYRCSALLLVRPSLSYQTPLLGWADCGVLCIVGDSHRFGFPGWRAALGSAYSLVHRVPVTFRVLPGDDHSRGEYLPLPRGCSLAAEDPGYRGGYMLRRGLVPAIEASRSCGASLL